MSTPSALVADRYRLVRMLGAGGMGVVWQAWDTRLRRPVALKMLRTQPELTDSERQVATDRAMREARNTAGLHHPHAVTVFDVVEHEGQPCIVMQLIESTPLSELLREHGALTPLETARIGAQVASALAAAHDLKIVHRDVKPGNILIAGDGSAMISDFGISHALGDTTITATGMIHGTPAYLAPEVARGLPTSFASDVFSLGSTLYAVVEGEPPFGTDRNPIALLHKVARGGYPVPKHAGPLAAPLRRMLASQPKRRPSMQSVAEILMSLQHEHAAADLSDDLRTLGFGAHAVTAAAGVAPAGAPNRGSADEHPATPETMPFTQAAAAASAEEHPDGPGAAATVPLGDHAAAVPLREDAPTVPLEDDAATGAHDDTAPPPPEVPISDPLGAPSLPAPIGRTRPMDQPTSYQPPTAETEPLGRAAPAAPAVGEAPAWTTQTPQEKAPRTTTRRRRAGIIAGAVILLVALGVGAALVLNLLRPGGVPEADPTPAPAASTTAPEPTSGTPQPVAPPATPSAPPTEVPREEEPAPVAPEQRVTDTISGYYAMMPGDRDAAWPLMTADYQENHAGGRGGYDAFWSQVAEVSASQVSATGPDQGQATLTYRFHDGRVVEEVTRYRFVDEGGVLKIAATEVLSSRGL
ncbi:serine/threonine-protein kinase [Microbacterium hibisci]|uniref:serine/threonine-protein kinase n=1 Tax=Microbacterium hibisci TaxID=2036000 RepID=UPI001943BAB5|nr:serine/threonine-protein kinase [Microbacterium hibisci]